MLKAPTSEPGFVSCALLQCLMPVWLKSFCHSIFAVTHLAAIWLTIGKFQKKSATITAMQSATVNQEVAMVAQRSGGPTAISPALQLAVSDNVVSSTRRRRRRWSQKANAVGAPALHGFKSDRPPRSSAARLVALCGSAHLRKSRSLLALRSARSRRILATRA